MQTAMKGGIIWLSDRLVSYTGVQANANGNRGNDNNMEGHDLKWKYGNL